MPEIHVGYRDSVRLALRAEYDSQAHQGGFRSLVLVPRWVILVRFDVRIAPAKVG